MQDDLVRQWGDRISVTPKKAARRVRLKVLPPGRVEVVVPLRFDFDRLPAILKQHEAWLRETVAKVSREHEALRAEPAPEHIELPGLQAQWTIEYRTITGKRLSCAEMDPRHLIVCHRETGDWRLPLRSWIVEKARERLPPMLERLSEQTGLDFNGVTIRGQKTRWGSCSSRKSISLNYGLAFLPPPLVRYVLIHELCHTVHLNHSADYWALVRAHEPDCRELDRELRHAGRLIPYWARPG